MKTKKLPWEEITGPLGPPQASHGHQRLTDTELAQEATRWTAGQSSSGWVVVPTNPKRDVILAVLEANTGLCLDNETERHKLHTELWANLTGLGHKEFHYIAWQLADVMDIDTFDILVSPVIEEICRLRGWEYDLEPYVKEFQKLDHEQRLNDSDC